MNRKQKVTILSFLMALIVGFSACESSEIDSSQSLKKPVKIIEVKKETFDNNLTYIGSINSQKTLKLAFKSSGKVSKVNVSIGDKVNVNTTLVSLEPIDVNFALDAASSQYDAAKSQVKKARDTADFIKKTYDDLEKLYESGSISNSQLDEAKLKLDIANSDYKSAVSSESQAKTNLNQKVDLRNELSIKSTVEGFVLDVLNEVGEFVGAGQPVVIIRNNNQTAIVGISQEDLSKIKLDTKVNVTIDGNIQKGNIIRISEIPDIETRTYEVEVMLEKSDNPLGAIGEVNFVIGEIVGMKIPVSSILSSDEDYVYIVKDGKATKSTIVVESVHEGSALVIGLNDSDQIVVEGMKNLKNFDEVKILE